MTRKKRPQVETETVEQVATAPPFDDDPILTISEAAAQLGKHRNTIGRWCDDGVISFGTHPCGVRGVRGVRQSTVDEILARFPV